MDKTPHRVRAFVTSDRYGPAEMLRDGPKAASRLAYLDADSKFVPEGWTPVGYADISLDLDKPDQMIASKVEALRAEETRTLADAQAKVTRIRRQINELQALPMEGGAA